MQDEIFPVCVPEIADRLTKHSDLAFETLLSDETWIDDWSIWASSVGGDIFLNSSGPVFSLFGLALQEAINGAGVLIGHGFLVEEYVRRGELVAPFSDRCNIDQSLYIRFNEQNFDDPVVHEIVKALQESCLSLVAPQ